MLDGIEQHPTVDGAASIAFIERFGSGLLSVIAVLMPRLAA